ncbi:uncharacterized protein LOC134718633 [Mytilus trossulus]|uniref:uncharacterized protein LOC134718633 n=1 Tax=Mytilus trossulus TaxID=6551 RepID=UPI003005690A
MQSQCAIQQHFSFFKHCDISVEELNLIALETTAFSLTEFDTINSLNNSMFKMEAFLKKLIRKGNHHCSMFLQGLSMKGHSSLVQVVTSNQDTNPDTRMTRGVYQFLTREFIINHLEFVCQNLQVTLTLDMLFEHYIITIDEHDLVQEKESKPSKRQELMRILLDRPETTWISGFLSVLRLTEHDRMLEQLQNLSTIGRVIGNQRSITISLGSTIPDEPTDFVACLGGSLHDVLNGTDAAVIEDALDAGLIDIWEGSIYLHLSSFSQDLIMSILNGDSNKLRVFLARLLQGNKKLLNYFVGQGTLHFRIQELQNNEFLGSSHGKKPRNQRAITNRDICLDCYRSTLRNAFNYRVVLDEIEDDIINETLRKVEKISKGHVFKKIIFSNKTRSENAVNFMQHVLYNEDVLEQFQKVFAYMSQIELKPFKCRKCSTGYSWPVLKMPRERTFLFNVELDDLGEVKISDITSGLKCPTVVLSPMIGSAGNRRMIRAMSLIDISAFEDVEEYRIVVMGDTKCRTDFYRTAKSLYRKMFKFYQLPSFRKKIIDEKEKKKIADCIARASPGPHAFVMFTESYDHLEIQSTMAPYIKYFGPDIVQFLILVFTTESHFVNYPVEMVEDFISSTVPLQTILKQCGGRYLVFHTHSEDESKCVQVKRLTKLIKQVHVEKAREYYSSEIFEKSEEAVKSTTDMVKIETKSEIKRLEDKVSLLKIENPREKAAKKLQSQKSFIDLVCHDDDVVG